MSCQLTRPGAFTPGALALSSIVSHSHLFYPNLVEASFAVPWAALWAKLRKN